MVRAILLVVLGTALGAGSYHLITTRSQGTRPGVEERSIRPSANATGRSDSPAGRSRVGPAFSEQSAVYAFAAQADTASLRAMIHETAARPESEERQFAFAVLLARLAELDPRGAIGLASDLNLDRQLIAALYGTWARTEPSAALADLKSVNKARDAQAIGLAIWEALGSDELALSQVLASLPPNYSTTHFHVEALRMTAESEPMEALRQAVALDDQSARFAAMRRIAEVWGAEDPRAALDHVELIGDERLRWAFLNMVIHAWSSLEPEAVLDYFVSLDEPGTGHARAAAMALDNLAGADPRRVLELSEQLPGMMRLPAQQSAITKWAEKDPLEALEYVKKLPMGQHRQTLMGAVARGYGKKDPEAALVWAQSLVPREDDILVSVLSGMAEGDPDRALDAALSLDDSNALAQVMTTITMISAYTMNPEKIANRILALPDGQTKEFGLRRLASSWANTDPEAAFAWLMTHGDKVGVHGFGDIAQQLAQRDVKTAAGYLDKIPEAAREVWISKVAESYAQVDPAGARAWISRFQGEQIYDAGVTAVVRQLAEYDPRAGARLVETIDDPRYVGTAARMVGVHWAQEDGPSAAAWAQDLDDPQARAAAISSVVQRWGARHPEDARRWVLALPPDSTRDAALGSLLPAIAGRKVPDSALFSAFQSDAARQRAMSSVVYHVARHDPSAARDLMDKYITDPTLRQQAEQMFESGAAQFGANTIR